MEYILIKCRNCDISTSLILKMKTSKEMSTKNKMHHVSLFWIISSSEQNKYNIKKNHPDWLNKGPRYNKAKILGLKYFVTIMKLY